MHIALAKPTKKLATNIKINKKDPTQGSFCVYKS